MAQEASKLFEICMKASQEAAQIQCTAPEWQNPVGLGMGKSGPVPIVAGCVTKPGPHLIFKLGTSHPEQFNIEVFYISGNELILSGSFCLQQLATVLLPDAPPKQRLSSRVNILLLEVEIQIQLH
eukprot:1140640-Pelagomonas_calceolata.AAC.11